MLYVATGPKTSMTSTPPPETLLPILLLAGSKQSLPITKVCSNDRGKRSLDRCSPGESVALQDTCTIRSPHWLASLSPPSSSEVQSHYSELTRYSPGGTVLPLATGQMNLHS